MCKSLVIRTDFTLLLTSLVAALKGCDSLFSEYTQVTALLCIPYCIVSEFVNCLKLNASDVKLLLVAYGEILKNGHDTGTGS